MSLILPMLHSPYVAAGGGSAVARTFVSAAEYTSGGVGADTDFPSQSLGSSANGDVLVIIPSFAGRTQSNITGVSADGNTLTEVAFWSNPYNNTRNIFAYKGACSASTGIVQIQHASASRSYAISFVYRITAAATLLDSQGDEGNGGVTTNVDTAVDGAVFFCGWHNSTNALGPTGWTQDDSQDDGSNLAAVGSDLISTADTPRSVSATCTGYGEGLALSYQP